MTTLRPEERATRAQEEKDRADITLNSNGKTFTFTISSRFTVYLDDGKYPTKDLQCGPEPVIGEVSNCSVNGWDFYPRCYEATQPGKCTLRNGGFAVTIIVVEPTSVPGSGSPYPTPASGYPLPADGTAYP